MQHKTQSEEAFMSVDAVIMQKQAELNTLGDDELAARLMLDVWDLQRAASQSMAIAAGIQALLKNEDQPAVVNLCEVIEDLHESTAGLQRLQAGLVFLRQRLEAKALPRAA